MLWCNTKTAIACTLLWLWRYLVKRENGNRRAALYGGHHGDFNGRIRPPLQENNVVLFLPHRGFTLQRHRLANELAQTGQVLAFFVQKQLNHLG